MKYYLMCEDYIYEFDVNYSKVNVCNLYQDIYNDLYNSEDVTKNLYDEKTKFLLLLYNFIVNGDTVILDYEASEENIDDLNKFRSFVSLDFAYKINYTDYLYDNNRVR